jgi:hypothetical protein
VLQSGSVTMAQGMLKVVMDAALSTINNLPKVLTTSTWTQSKARKWKTRKTVKQQRQARDPESNDPRSLAPARTQERGRPLMIGSLIALRLPPARQNSPTVRGCAAVEFPGPVVCSSRSAPYDPNEAASSSVHTAICSIWLGHSNQVYAVIDVCDRGAGTGLTWFGYGYAMCCRPRLM